MTPNGAAASARTAQRVLGGNRVATLGAFAAWRLVRPQTRAVSDVVGEPAAAGPVEIGVEEMALA